MIEIIASLREAARFAREAAHALSDLAAHAINVIDGDLFSRRVPKHFSVNYTDDVLSLIDTLLHPIVHTSSREVIVYRRNILLVAIGENVEHISRGGKLHPSRELFVESVAGEFIPFTDGEANQKGREALYGEVGIGVSDFAQPEALAFAMLFFFLTKPHISSISTGVRLSSFTKYSL